MYKNYLKVAIRNLLKFKIFSFINILGLSIGISVFLIIFLFVSDELTYDSFHKNADNIYRVGMHLKFGDTDIKIANGPSPLANTLVNEFPEVLTATRLRRETTFIFKGNEKFKEEDFYYSDSTFGDIFSLDLIYGNMHTALLEPNSVIITSSVAEKYFGQIMAIGQTIRTTDGKELLVTGIAKELPQNSSFKPKFLASINLLEMSRNTDSWISNFAPTYILLQKNASYLDLESKFPKMVKKYIPQLMGTSFEDFEKAGNKYEFFIQPLSSIHFSTGIYNEFEDTGDKTTIYIFSAIAFFILLIACINFVNLSTALSTKRANEIGVRKVLGSNRSQIIKQFLIETILLTTIAVTLSLIFVELLSPLITSISGKTLSVNYFGVWYIIPSLILGSFLLGIFAGSYPAIFISSLQLVSVLKGKIFRSPKGITLKKGLVVFQFVISIFLLIGTFVILSQVNYIRDKDLGYNGDQVMIIQNAEVLDEKIKAFEESLKSYPGVINLSKSTDLQNYNLSLNLFKKANAATEDYSMVTIGVDYNFLDTYRIQLISGRNFSKAYSTDTLAVIINQTAVGLLGFENPIGEELTTLSGNNNNLKVKIIGVVKDFHTQQLHEAIRPSIFFLTEFEGVNFVSVKVGKENIPTTIDFIKSEWDKLVPEQAIDYAFFNDNFEELYKAEIRMSKLFSSFATLAIFIACLGLLGLTTFAVEQRTKEIGIRKVMGARIGNIIFLLSKEFIIWILIANIITWPIAYYFLDKWLQDFVYRTEINLLLFVTAGLVVLIISFLAVVYQAVKAAMINPVKSLKYE